MMASLGETGVHPAVLLEKDSDGSEAWGGMPRGEPSLSIPKLAGDVPSFASAIRRRRQHPSVRVGLATQDCEASVQLLGQHHAREAMRERELREGKLLLRAV